VQQPSPAGRDGGSQPLVWQAAARPGCLPLATAAPRGWWGSRGRCRQHPALPPLSCGWESAPAAVFTHTRALLSYQGGAKPLNEPENLFCNTT